MASGVAISDDVVQAFNKIKMKSTQAHAGTASRKFIVLHIHDNKIIQVDESANDEAAYPNDYETGLYKFLCECEARRECRYAIADVPVEGKSGAMQDKIALIAWCPDNASIKQKMIYTSSADALKKKLGGEGGFKFVQANDMDEISLDHVKDVLKSH